MEGKLARTCTYALLALLAASVVALATNNNFALAQPCQAQLGSPSVSAQGYYYYGTNLQVIVPVSASCSFYPGQLYAIGTAYDTNSNTNIGTASTVLSSTYGGYGFTGQLTFNLPPSPQYTSVQFSVSIYGAQNGYYGGYGNPNSLLATASSTFAIGPSYYQTYPSYPYYYYYPSYPSYGYYYSGSGCYNCYYHNGNYYHSGSYYHNGNYYHSGTYYHNGNYYHSSSYYHSNGNNHPPHHP